MQRRHQLTQLELERPAPNWVCLQVRHSNCRISWRPWEPYITTVDCWYSAEHGYSWMTAILQNGTSCFECVRRQVDDVDVVTAGQSCHASMVGGRFSLCLSASLKTRGGRTPKVQTRLHALHVIAASYPGWLCCARDHTYNTRIYTESERRTSVARGTTQTSYA